MILFITASLLYTIGSSRGNIVTMRNIYVPISAVKTAALKIAHNDLLLKNSAAFTAARSRAGALFVSAEINNPLIAPLAAGSPAGWLIISDEQGELYRLELLVSKNYEKGNIFKRIWDSIKLLFYKPR